MDNSVIYYFSGSGNSYNIAKGIGETIGNTTLIRICDENLYLSDAKKYKIIGIVFPVYYFSIPKMVKEFVKKLNMDNDSYIYGVATCGGFVGVSFTHLKEILEVKGYKLNLTFKVIMPDNYQILYSPATEAKKADLINNSIKEIQKISSVIMNKEGHYQKEPNLILRKVEEIGHSLFNPKNKDNNFWVDDGCNGCSICEKVCPAKDIVIENEKPKWLNNCEQCLACFQWCPKEAIQYKRSTVNRGRYTHPNVKAGDLFLR